MLRIRRILFPTDFSECADQALGLALRFAEAHGAELHMFHAVVLHAADPANPALQFPDEERVVRELRQIAGSRMEATVERHETREVRIQRVQQRAISPVAAILDYADEQEVDLIVMGTHGRRALGRVLMGSVAREVVRQASCPVLTVRASEDGGEVGREIRRILVPVDFSDYARMGFDTAVAVAETFGARLQALHVVEEALYPDFYYPILASSENVPAEIQERLEKALAEWLEETGGRPAEVALELHVGAGRAAAEIATFAEEHDSDLIVLSSHGRTGLERVLVGSVAEGTIRRAPCPVLTVKAFGRRPPENA